MKEKYRNMKEAFKEFKNGIEFWKENKIRNKKVLVDKSEPEDLFPVVMQTLENYWIYRETEDAFDNYYFFPDYFTWDGEEYPW